MLKIIRELLLKIVDDLDVENSNIDTIEAQEIVLTLSRIIDKKRKYSKYSACQYLNVSRATFDNYIKEGVLPKGVHEIGFKELSWTKMELDKFINNTQKLKNNV